MKKLWEEFPSVVQRVRSDHRRNPRTTPGHDWYHALSVAQYAQRIAESEDVGRLAWVAGICHNTDRLFQLDDDGVEPIVQVYLSESSLTKHERHLIVDAVLEHSKKNTISDSVVTIILKDADRLANLDASHLVRTGQFKPCIPVVDLRFMHYQDPTATFQDPKSHLRNLQHTLEWETWMRLPKAQALAAEKCAFIRAYTKRLVQEWEALGLDPYPLELLA